MTTKERIISTYHQLDSIKETSRVLRISEQSVRRILVNAGEYSNSRYILERMRKTDDGRQEPFIGVIEYVIRKYMKKCK